MKDNSVLQGYPGAKNNSGILQFYCNNTPLHTTYHELFAGSAAYYFFKRPANNSVLADIDGNVCKILKGSVNSNDVVLNCNTLDLLDISVYSSSDFIFLDPPYPESARRSGNSIYRNEMLQDEIHLRLLTRCCAIPANIRICTRQNHLYDQVLKGWRKKEFNTVDRGGKCIEIIYMNYSEPEILHQYDFLGKDFTDRQRIKRKAIRQGKRFASLPTHEKYLQLKYMAEHDAAAVQMFLSMGYLTNNKIVSNGKD